ncbi:MAG: hypothetical protein AAF772_14550 [Acidobacteriota bacterium]
MARRNEPQARRLLRNLQLPDDAPRVLLQPRYWTAEFFDRYLETCDEWLANDPLAGRIMAAVAPRLAERIDERCRLEPDAVSAPFLHVRAHLVHASALRAAGDLTESELAFEAALQAMVASAAEMPLSLWRDLQLRRAHLRMVQGRFAEAGRLVDAILDHSPEEDDAHVHGRARLLRGSLCVCLERHDEALAELSAALRHLDARRSPRAYHAAIHNFAGTLTVSANHPGALAQALNHLRQARRSGQFGRRSVPKLKLRWIEGLILMRVGATRRAERAFERARRGLAELGAAWEVVAIAVDHSELLMLEDRFEELEQLAAEIFPQIDTLGIDTGSYDALTRWRDAVATRGLNCAVIDAARDALLMGPPRSPSSAAS